MRAGGHRHAVRGPDEGTGLQMLGLVVGRRDQREATQPQGRAWVGEGEEGHGHKTTGTAGHWEGCSRACGPLISDLQEILSLSQQIGYCYAGNNVRDHNDDATLWRCTCTVVALHLYCCGVAPVLLCHDAALVNALIRCSHTKPIDKACHVPYALCPMPYALCPVPGAWA